MNNVVEKNLLVRDPDGNWYSIPPCLKAEFDATKESESNCDIVEDWIMHPWFEQFDQYLVV